MTINQHELSNDSVTSNLDVLLFGAPQEKFDQEEIKFLQNYLENGKSIILLLSETMNKGTISSINNLLKNYGITVEHTPVVRTSHYKYFHPKNVFISDGVLHSDILKAKQASKVTKGDGEEELFTSLIKRKTSSNLSFVYPHGLTINVEPPSVGLLSSGQVSFPVNRPVAAAWRDSKPNSSKTESGKLLVMASADAFSDAWIDKEDNKDLFEIFLRFISNDEHVQFNREQVVGKVDEERCIPDIEVLSERLKCCLQENEPLPQDINELFCDHLTEFDISLLPEVVKLYDTLKVKEQPLSLIPPEFECPIPPLSLSVFAPRMRDPLPPALDQFDLDEEFADRQLRLDHLKSKCTNDDLNYYMEMAAKLLGISEARPNFDEGKHILHKIAQSVRIFL